MPFFQISRKVNELYYLSAPLGHTPFSLTNDSVITQNSFLAAHIAMSLSVCVYYDGLSSFSFKACHCYRLIALETVTIFLVVVTG